MSELQTRYGAVKARIDNAMHKYRRSANSVQLLAVSKTKPVEAIRELAMLGQRAFGESYAQEALSKIEALRPLNLEWHFIGPIQSNKTKIIANDFHWVHSIDREKIALRLNEQRETAKPPLNVCIQVNVSGERTKSGVLPDDTAALVASIRQLPNLKLRGLMAIPEVTEDVALQHQAFRQLASLLSQINDAFGLQLDTLSMGMSNDFDAAIAEGATMVRVGSDIFGARE